VLSLLATPSLQQAVVHGSIQQLHCPLAEKGSFSKGTLDTLLALSY
jgi:hypothetical protein